MGSSGRQLSSRAKGLLLTASVSQTLWGAASSDEHESSGESEEDVTSPKRIGRVQQPGHATRRITAPPTEGAAGPATDSPKCIPATQEKHSAAADSECPPYASEEQQQGAPALQQLPQDQLLAEQHQTKASPGNVASQAHGLSLGLQLPTGHQGSLAFQHGLALAPDSTGTTHAVKQTTLAAGSSMSHPAVVLPAQLAQPGAPLSTWQPGAAWNTLQHAPHVGTSPVKVALPLGPTSGLQRYGSGTPERSRSSGHMASTTNTNLGGALPISPVGAAQGTKGTIPLVQSPRMELAQAAAQVSTRWQGNSIADTSKLTGVWQGLPAAQGSTAPVFSTGAVSGLTTGGHVPLPGYQQQPAHTLQPMNLQEKMSWWASAARSPFNAITTNNMPRFAQFPTTGTTSLAAVPGLTSGASAAVMGRDTAGDVGEPVESTPLPAGGKAAVLPSTVSTPWDSDALNALDSIERRYVAGAGMAPAAAMPHRTAGHAGPPAEAEAGVPLRSVLDLLNKQIPKEGAVTINVPQQQLQQQQQGLPGNIHSAHHPVPSVSITAAQQAGMLPAPSARVHGGWGQLAAPACQPPSAQNAAVSDSIAAATGAPNSIMAHAGVFQPATSPAPTTVSRVPETVAPSGQSTPLSAGMLSAMNMALDNLERMGQCGAPVPVPQSWQGAAQQQAAVLLNTFQPVHADAAIPAGQLGMQAPVHTQQQQQQQQQRDEVQGGQKKPEQGQAGRSRFGVAFAFEDTPETDVGTRKPVQPNLQHQPAAEHAVPGGAAAPTPLPVKQLAFTPYVRGPKPLELLYEAADGAGATPLFQPQPVLLPQASLQHQQHVVAQAYEQQQVYPVPGSTPARFLPAQLQSYGQQALAANVPQLQQSNTQQQQQKQQQQHGMSAGPLGSQGQAAQHASLRGPGVSSNAGVLQVVPAGSTNQGIAHQDRLQPASTLHDAQVQGLQSTGRPWQQQQPPAFQHGAPQASLHNRALPVGTYSQGQHAVHGQYLIMQENAAQHDSDDDSDEDGDEGGGLRADDIPPGLSQAATQARLNMMSSGGRRVGTQGGGTPGSHCGAALVAATPRTGSQRLGTSLAGSPRTPTPPTTQISCDLEAYLPVEIAEVYRNSCGVKDKLYQWQAECLMLPDVLRGRNLVFAAPTSAGKSIVYEVLCLRRLLTTQRPFMLVLPTVALCHQKAVALEKLLAPMCKHVKKFFGGIKSGAHVENDTGAIVCTIEMANKLVNRMLEEDSLSQLGALVVDELHMVGEDDRGYLLELLLTKLRYATETLTSDKEADGGSTELVMQEGVQVIGMSATMPNVAEVAKWLGAELYQTDFRPVKLKEFIKVGAALKDAQLNVVRTLEPPTPTWDHSKDPDHVALLARETVVQRLSCLVFCASKLACENVAKGIMHCLGSIPEAARAGLLNTPTGAPKSAHTTPAPANTTGQTPAAGTGAQGQVTPATGGTSAPPENSRAAFVAALKALAGDTVLLEVMACGIAYHHRGLSSEECELVEKAYKAGAVSVLCCTSTMAVGVNLPAARVIFRHPFKGIPKFGLSVAEYRQMAGRAGRAGIDTQGESVLITSKEFPEAKLVSLMRDAAAPIESALIEARRGMKRAIMEVVVCGAVCDASDVSRFIKCTLLAATRSFQDVVATATKAALKWLCEQKFISWDNSTCTYIPQPLGKATVEAGMDPDDALLVKKDLAKAREGFVMATDLHLTYLVTPPRVDNIFISWDKYFHIADRLQGPDLVVMTLLGIKPKHLLDLKQGRGAAMNKEQERVAYKFYAAMALNDLVNETDINEVTSIYGLQKAPLRDLQDRATKTAGMVAAFCSQLGWGDLEMLVTKFQGRIHTGVQADIVALTEIPGIGAFRARVLFKAGLRTPELIAGCDVIKITEVLLASKASGGKGQTDEAQMHARERRAAKLILAGARELLNARAAELQQEAMAMWAAAAKGSQVTSAAGRTPQQTPAAVQSGQQAPALPAPVPSSASQVRSETKEHTKQLQQQPQQQLRLQQQPDQQQLLLPPIDVTGNAAQAVATTHQRLLPPTGAAKAMDNQGVQVEQQHMSKRVDGGQGQHLAAAKRQCLESPSAVVVSETEPVSVQPMPLLPQAADRTTATLAIRQEMREPVQEDSKRGQSVGQTVPVPTVAGVEGPHGDPEASREGPAEKKHCSAGAWEHGRRHLSGRAPDKAVGLIGLVPPSYQQQARGSETVHPQVSVPAIQGQKLQQGVLQQPQAAASLPPSDQHQTVRTVHVDLTSGLQGAAQCHVMEVMPQQQKQKQKQAVLHHQQGQRAPMQLQQAAASMPNSNQEHQVAHQLPVQGSTMPAVPSGSKAASSHQGGWITSKRSKTSNTPSEACTHAGNATSVNAGPGLHHKNLSLNSPTKACPIPMVVQPNQPAQVPRRDPTGPLATEGLILVDSLQHLQELYAVVRKVGRCAFALCFTGRAGGDRNSGGGSGAGDGGEGGTAPISKPTLQLPNPHAKQRPAQICHGPDHTAQLTAGATCRPSAGSCLTSKDDAGEQPASWSVPVTADALSRVLGSAPQAGPDEVLPYDQGDVRGAAISLHDGVCYFVQLSDGRESNELRGEEQLQMLCLLLHLLCDKDITKITCYVKQQIKALAAAALRWPALSAQPGCEPLPRKELWALRPPLVDVVLVCWLLEPQDARDDSMEKSINGRTGKRAWHTKLLEALSQFSQTAAREALSIISTNMPGRGSAGSTVSWEACQVEVMKRAALSRKLYENREASLIQQGLLKPLLELEMPLVPAVACLEMWGMHLDLGVLLLQRRGLSKREKQLESHIYKACGQKLNLASYQEVGDLLFRKLHIPPPPTATKGKHFSTAAEVLEEVVEQHPVVSLILEHRKITKLLQLLDTTLKDGKDQASIRALAALSPRRMAAAVAEVRAGSSTAPSGLPQPLVRLRGTFFQTGTVSGRLSMDDPNLQTVPRPADYQLELSQQVALMDGLTGAGDAEGQPAVMDCQVNVRAAFTAPEGYVILAVDYKQVELRLMAHFSQDAGLLAMLREDGRDPFKGLAAGWLGITEAEVTPKQRTDAKHLAYGLLYGLGPHGLAKKLGCTVAQAFQVQAEFQNSLPGVMTWCERVIDSSRQLGHITTLGGRKRYFSETEKKDRDKMARQAVNTTCQGSAADLIKKAMISLHPVLNKGNLAGTARLVHMVHDELVYEVASGKVAAVATLVSQQMTGAAAGLNVPFPVEISMGPSWGELKETRLEQLTT